MTILDERKRLTDLRIKAKVMQLEMEKQGNESFERWLGDIYQGLLEITDLKDLLKPEDIPSEPLNKI